MSELHIGVFGDSYADRVLDPIQVQFKVDESWMAHINSKGHKVSSYGLSGTASWYSYQCFKKYYKQFDHIVFCWSFPHRMQTIPHKYAMLASIGDVEQFYANGNYKNYTGEEQAEIVQMILGYKYLRDHDFNFWAQQKMFDDVNDMCRENNIKLVNILPFVTRTDLEINFSKRAGDCLFRLFEVSFKELDSGNVSDCRSTHLSKENNAILAEIILRRFSEGKNLIVDLYKQGDFVYSDDITNRYIKYSHTWSQMTGMNKNTL